MSHADSKRVGLVAPTRSRLEAARSGFAFLPDCRINRSGEAP
jgi:hypothetical protein